MLQPLHGSGMMPHMIDGALSLSFELDRVTPQLLTSMEGQLTAAIPDEVLCAQCFAIADTAMRYLVQAVAVDEPGVFAQYVTWVCGTSEDDTMAEIFPTLLDALSAAIRTEIPGPAKHAALRAIETSFDSLKRPMPMRERADIDASTREGKHALQYLGLLLAGERDGALDIIRAAAEESIPVGTIVEKVILPVQRSVGALWHAGEITIADEHFITATSEMALTVLRPWYPDPVVQDKRVLISTVGGDMHSFGARVASDFFEMDGWETLYLGANTPRQDLLDALVHYRAPVLALAVTSQLHLRPVALLIRSAREDAATRDVRVLLGGRAVDQHLGLGERMGADAVVDTPREAPKRALELLAGGAVGDAE